FNTTGSQFTGQTPCADASDQVKPGRKSTVTGATTIAATSSQRRRPNIEVSHCAKHYFARDRAHAAISLHPTKPFSLAVNSCGPLICLMRYSSPPERLGHFAAQAAIRYRRTRWCQSDPHSAILELLQNEL